jgi:outer membrane protein
MSRFVKNRTLLSVLAFGSFAVPVLAQNPPDKPAPVPPQDNPQTQPVQPRIQATPLPPAVVIPPPPQDSPLPKDVPSRPLTADEAARIALANQPNIVAAQANILAAQGRTEQARSGLLPSVSLSAGYNRVNTLDASGNGGGPNTVGISTATGYNSSVTIRQLIYDFNRTRDTVRQNRALERAANANLTRTQFDTILQVKQAFYTYVQNVRLIGVNESNLRNQQAQLALAEARAKSGLGAPIDVVRAQTNVAAAILNLNLAQNVAATSRVNLALLMGIDPRTPIQASDAPEPGFEATDINLLTQRAFNLRPEILQAQANIEAAKLSIGIAKTTNAPSIAATLSLSSRDVGNIPPRNDFATLGASINWTPFDSGLTSGRVREARANYDSARTQLTLAQLNITSDVAQAYVNLRTAEQRVVSAAAQVTNALEGVRLAEGRYRAGVTTFLEVTDAQTALVTAQTNQVNANSAVDQARAALARAIGTPINSPAPAAPPANP